MQATKQTLGAAKTYSTGFSSDNFPADGLLGMAFKSLSDYNANPLFQSLVAQGKTTSSVFSFKLASSGSELYIGGKNSNLYTGSITYTPVTTAVRRIRSLTRCSTLTWFIRSPTGRLTWTDWRLMALPSFRRRPLSLTRAPPKLSVTLTTSPLSTPRSAVRCPPRNTAMASTPVRSQHSLYRVPLLTVMCFSPLQLQHSHHAHLQRAGLHRRPEHLQPGACVEWLVYMCWRTGL